ncbi:MAG: hypothetical protein C4575_10500 [Desulforudis sp.]|jgi:hypothetical protein|nr:MAG: hypothetical protein C4575_10500 [Desulforudis sp.]
MSFIGEYRFECNEGRLILHPNLCPVRCFLSNESGLVQLCPNYDPEDGQHLLPFGYRRTMDWLQDILNSYAGRILEAVSIFRENKASLLKLCFNAGKQAVELMDDCPALISLIAARLDPIESIHEYTDQARYIVQLKREHILSYCSYPSSRSTIKMMRKIPASDSGLAHLELFRKIIVEGKCWKIKVLQHADRINWLVLHLLSGGHFESHIRPSFVLDVGRVTDPDELFEAYQQISEIQRIVTPPRIRLKIPCLMKLQDLGRNHDRLVAEYMEARKFDEILELEFPEPPLPGVEISGEDNGSYGIFPLANGRALRDEGLRMNHCIATYAYDIVLENGLLYAYHVDLPSKPPATVLIRRNPCSWTLEVHEIRGFHNAPVNPDVEFYVNEWLAKQGAIKSGKDQGYTEAPSC